jgi:hypothetical protein
MSRDTTANPGQAEGTGTTKTLAVRNRTKESESKKSSRFAALGPMDLLGILGFVGAVIVLTTRQLFDYSLICASLVSLWFAARKKAAIRVAAAIVGTISLVIFIGLRANLFHSTNRSVATPENSAPWVTITADPTHYVYRMRYLPVTIGSGTFGPYFATLDGTLWDFPAGDPNLDTFEPDNDGQIPGSEPWCITSSDQFAWLASADSLDFINLGKSPKINRIPVKFNDAVSDITIDGKSLYTASYAGVIDRRSVSSGKVLAQFKSGYLAWGIAFFDGSVYVLEQPFNDASADFILYKLSGQSLSVESKIALPHSFQAASMAVSADALWIGGSLASSAELLKFDGLS